MNKSLQAVLNPNQEVHNAFKDGKPRQALSLYFRQIQEVEQEDFLKIIEESVRLEAEGGS